MIGSGKPTIQQFQLKYGTYVQAHEHPTYSNTMDGQVVGAIALLPSNDNNGWCFLSLYIGQIITRYDWTILPISEEVLHRVEQLASSEGMLNFKNHHIFEWKPGDPVKLLEDNAIPHNNVSSEGADGIDNEYTPTDPTATSEAIQQYHQSQYNNPSNYFAELMNHQKKKRAINKKTFSMISQQQKKQQRPRQLLKR